MEGVAFPFIKEEGEGSSVWGGAMRAHGLGTRAWRERRTRGWGAACGGRGATGQGMAHNMVWQEGGDGKPWV